MENPFLEENITAFEERKILDLDKILNYLKEVRAFNLWSSPYVLEQMNIKDDALIGYYANLLDKNNIAEKDSFKGKLQLTLTQIGIEFDSFKKEQERQKLFYEAEATKKAADDRIKEERAEIPSRGLRVTKNSFKLAIVFGILGISATYYGLYKQNIGLGEIQRSIDSLRQKTQYLDTLKMQTMQEQQLKRNNKTKVSPL